MSWPKPKRLQKMTCSAASRRDTQQFEALLAPLSEAQMTTPHVNGPWSVKDNLAHLTVWQDYVLSQLQGILTNQQPPEFMPGLSTEDEENEYIYQENKDRPLAEVQTAFRASYQRVLAAVQAMSEPALNAPSPWSTTGNPIWAFGCRQHLRTLRGTWWHHSALVGWRAVACSQPGASPLIASGNETDETILPGSLDLR